ncbi:MAG: Flp pilus assembly complex ATPase component TadA [archaeon]|nr:MAG: Flp pilus assembly complex ATPase component TadA [archaeon]
MPLRVPTGLPKLDSLLEGGIMKNSMILVTGGTGTGKTILCLQFLWEGLQKGEPCVYLSLEEDPDDIKADARQFGWDLEKYEEKGLFRIMFHDPFETDVSSVLVNQIEYIKAKRLVVDSMSMLGLYMKDQATVRKQLGKLMKAVKNAECTTLVTSEIVEESKALSRFGVEEFVVDGVIVLNYLGIGQEANRSLQIRKMRRTNHGKDIYPFKMTSKGIEIMKEGMGDILK